MENSCKVLTVDSLCISLLVEGGRCAGRSCPHPWLKYAKDGPPQIPGYGSWLLDSCEGPGDGAADNCGEEIDPVVADPAAALDGCAEEAVEDEPGDAAKEGR